MDMQWLDDVLVLLEEGNMTRAAARRNITQPAFSRRIRSFEEWIGSNLLDRQANSVAINPSLRDNEPEIRALLRGIRDLRSKIKNHDPAHAVLSISAQHAPIFATFPDMALHARRYYPAIKFRLRAGNLRDCVSMFLRGDTQVLLCHESTAARPLPFDDSVRRVVWGTDYLIPVIGGALRYVVRDDGSIPIDTAAIVYPEGSYFGEVLKARERAFSTHSLCEGPLCETALSSGIKQLVLAGLGVGWVPFSMVYREVESGDMFSLANVLGKEPLDVALYADKSHAVARDMIDVWARGKK